ncbi:hypothetical protein ACFYY8_13300 [Streptosporangium sp. NPDC001559]|uniref:FXSXX-COOH protein n=1 Tax=Streptosporangium jomthongense TaxID=1193683 RepID=A0ABV8EVQ9_9ACTN
MTVRIDDLDGSAEVSDEVLGAVVGGRPPMTPPTPRYASSLGNGTQGDPLPDIS